MRQLGAIGSRVLTGMPGILVRQRQQFVPPTRRVARKKIEIALTLASHVASAIHRIRLLEAQLQYEAKLEALHKHANELAGATTIGEIAENTIESMYATLGMKSCDFLTVEDDHLRLIDYRGWIPSDPDQKFPLDGLGILVKAANTKQTILLPDVREDSSYVEYVGKEAEGGKKYQPLSELCVPVISGGEVVAVLNTESNQLDFYDARDQVLLETLASHVASAIQRIKYREGMRDLAYKLNNLEPGGCYLSESHERCLKAYAVLSMENVPGLCIVREDPQRLVEGYGIKKDEIVLLSSRPFDDWETIDDLQLLSRTLSRFLESGEGVVLLVGLEYLITRFGFEVVYSFIQEKRFDFLRSKTVLLVPVDMRTLDEHQQALLSSEFTVLK